MSIAFALSWKDTGREAEIIPLAAQAAQNGPWADIAARNDFEFFGRFLPIPVCEEYLPAIMREAIILRDELNEITPNGEWKEIQWERMQGLINRLEYMQSHDDWEIGSIG